MTYRPAPMHVAVPVDPARTGPTPFVAAPAAIQPEPVRAEIIAVIDRAAIPKAAEIDRIVPRLVEAVVRRIAPRRLVIIARIGIGVGAARIPRGIAAIIRVVIRIITGAGAVIAPVSGTVAIPKIHTGR